MRLLVFAVFLVATLLPAPRSASALCACMVFRRPTVQAGSVNTGITSDPGYSPSAAVFIVRDGVKTVLTMEPAYDGPKVPISMILPVPTSIERDQVQTVPGSIFRNLDRLTAPRVQHVFPGCRRPRRRRARGAVSLSSTGGGGGGGVSFAEPTEPPVEVVDEWALDEYDISVLSATESTSLLDFVRERGLNLPAAAEPALRAYIETGHRFVFATVDPTRAHVVADRMVLSPIQLSYESDSLVVPVRLGTINSPGEQELLLYVLAKGEHYEVANRESVVAPTELRLGREAAGSVAELYGALMDEQFRQKPGAVVTEYAFRLGHRVGYHHIRRLGLSQRARESGQWTLTRMRHRFAPNQHDDLTLRAAAAPLRMPHPHRFVPRVWARRGNSGFYVRFLVRHSSCANAHRQRRLARRYATAESIWESAETRWPGELLLDDVESLGIAAGSSAPPGWPPLLEPAPAAAPEPAAAPDQANVPAAEPSTAEPSTTEPSTAEPSAAERPTEPTSPQTQVAELVDSGCSVGSASGTFPMILALWGLWGVARVRRGRGARRR
ncbi:MAG: DUF2330 domain-containing protein [Polyangiales bacterium]